jgi:hypothetical protein
MKELSEIKEVKKELVKVEKQLKGRKPRSYVPKIKYQTSTGVSAPLKLITDKSKKNEKLGYVGTPVGENNLDYSILDPLGFCQILAGYLNYHHPYLFTVNGTGASSATLAPSTLAAYCGLAVLQYFLDMEQLLFGSSFTPPSITYFQKDWEVPQALAFFLSHVGKGSLPICRNFITLPQDFALNESGIYPTGSAYNWSSLMLPAAAGFQWFNASSINEPNTVTAGSAYYATLANVQQSTFPAQFPYTTWLTGTTSFLSYNNSAGPNLISRVLKASQDIKTVRFDQIPQEAPDLSGFCFPMSSSVSDASATWWNCSSCTCPGPIFDVALATVLQPSRTYFNNAICPTFFLDCAADVTWPVFNPTQNTSNFILASNTPVEQYMQTFIWLGQNADKYYMNGRAVRFQRYVTLGKVHLPSSMCKILPAYVDYYSYIQNCVLILTRYIAGERGSGQVFPTSDTSVAYIDYCTELFRAKTHLYQLDMGRCAGTVNGVWGHMNSVVGPGILDGATHVALKALIDQIGLVKTPGNYLYFPQIDENYAAAICGASAINGLVQFPFLAGGAVTGYSSTPLFNGTTNFPWFPFNNLDQPTNVSWVTATTGPNQIGGEGSATLNTNINGLNEFFYLAQPVFNRSATLAAAYLAVVTIVGASSFKAQINGLYGWANALVDYIQGYFTQATSGKRSVLGLVNRTLFGGPGMLGYVVNNALSSGVSAEQLLCIPVDNLGNPAAGGSSDGGIDTYNPFYLHQIYTQARLESSTVLTEQDAGIVFSTLIRNLYRSTDTSFSLVGVSSFFLTKYELRSQFKVLIGDLVAEDSEALSEYMDNQKKHMTKYKGDSFWCRNPGTNYSDDCLKSVMKMMGSRIGSVIVHPDFSSGVKKGCNMGVKAAQFLGLPIPGGAFACQIAEQAANAAQAVVHHYSSKNSKPINVPV